MNEKQPIIFCDFDGTLTQKDVGHALFTYFSGGRNLPLVEKWKKMIISSRECLQSEAALLNDIKRDKIYSFLDKFNLRAGVKEFYREMRSRDIPIYIVSDGADIYIEYILRRHGLEDIPFFSNRVRIESGRYVMEFPYDNDGCERCGSCKGARINEIIRRRPGDNSIVFIGDGLSDICAAPHADLIFARGDFLAYCRNNEFKAVEYENFFDILNYMKDSAGI